MAAAVESSRGQAAAGEEAASETEILIALFFHFLDSEISSGLPDDSYSSGDEALDGDDEDEAAVVEHATEETANSKAGPGSGWADAMAKVLNKKIPQNKSIILAKSKKLEKEREKERQERLEKRRKLDKKKEWEMMCRVKPDVVKDRDRERNLQRIATR
ncbi:hypothetical protein CIB84_002462 [Bambusicola thoracicus]|uniref:RRP15-like protein n=1 Tax=Bambusicola thoracicus TaxID=9083 RepID=A0A2P4TBQ5_BAMTH|nr:hypothetical protein CIB84_002462 [Bambusicola thoracicus]